MRNHLIVALFAAGLLGCAHQATRDIQITVKVDPKANMTGYKTYAWSGGMGALNDPDHVWTPTEFDIDAEVRFLVDSNLRAKGLTATEDKPDLSVMYLMVVDTDRQAAELRKKYGEKADISGLSEAALVVGLVDNDTGFVVWLGAASAPAHPFRDDATAKARIGAAVNNMFKELNR
jgi:hypothetical protein